MAKDRGNSQRKTVGKFFLPIEATNSCFFMKIRLKNKDQIPFKIVPVVLKPAEARHQNENIFEAYASVLSSILKRPVSQAELYGVKSLESELRGA